MRICTFLLLTLPYFYSPNSSAQQLSSNEWIEDIDFLTSKMAKTIPEFDNRVNQVEFNRKIEYLKSNISTYSESKIVFSLQQILSLVQDEGCSIYPFQPRLNYKIAPIKSYWFKEGLIICDASEEYKHLINQKIIAVNGIPIDTVNEKLSPYISADNAYFKKHYFPYSMNMPSLLDAVGVGNEQNHIILTLESGQVETVNPKQVGEYAMLKRNLAGRGLDSSSKNHSGANYWMEYLPASKTLYVQFLQIRNSNEGVSFDSFVKKVKERLTSTEVERVIIDNRYGGGGNGFKLKPFTDLIRESENINQKGKLFVLTSRSTRGTIMEMTSILELNTKAIMVGEPTGEGPNTVGDNTSIELPNSKIQVSLTHTFWPTSWLGDTRTYITPNKLVEYSALDYKSHKDPWMEAIENYEFDFDNKEQIPEAILSDVSGDYTVQNHKIKIKKFGNEIYLSMDRKMKSFFEIHTQLYWQSEGLFSTDISKVFINYSTDVKGKLYLTSIDWKGVKLEIKN